MQTYKIKQEAEEERNREQEEPEQNIKTDSYHICGYRNDHKCLCIIRSPVVFFCIVPPLLYAIYAGIGYVRGWEFSRGTNYPYFFLNWGSPAGAFGFISDLPFMGTAWWILTLFLFLIIVGRCYLAIAESIGNRITKGSAGDYEATKAKYISAE